MDIQHIKIKRNSLSPKLQLLLLALPVVLGMIIYYSWLWESVAEFVLAVDHTSQIFADFISYYYPMGKQILENPQPYPGFYYSAFFALLMVPFGWFEENSAMIVWGAFQMLSLIGLCILPLWKLLKLPPLTTALYFLVFLSSFPILHNFKWGQVSVLMTLGVIAAFHACDSKRPILAGIILAFVTFIKFYPAVFVMYFIIKKDWKTCISFGVAGMAFFFLLPIIVLGPGDFFAFEKARTASLSGAELRILVADPNSQYLPHVVARWIEYFRPITSPHFFQYGSICAGLIFVFNLVVIWYCERQKASDQLILSLTLLFVSIPLLVKTSWPHYFAFLPFCQLALMKLLLAGDEKRTWWRIALLAFPVSSIILSSVFYFTTYYNWESYSRYGIIFTSNLILILGVYLVVGLKIFRKGNSKVEEA